MVGSLVVGPVSAVERYQKANLAKSVPPLVAQADAGVVPGVVAQASIEGSAVLEEIAVEHIVADSGAVVEPGREEQD